MNNMQKVILVVDDDAAARYVVGRVVKVLGWPARVVEAASLDAAREKMASEAPDVVLADRTLPDGDGLVWLRTLRGPGRDLFCLSGIDTPAEPGIGMLLKPVDLTTFEAQMGPLFAATPGGISVAP
jgi:CheY-like chemotaxis protein